MSITPPDYARWLEEPSIVIHPTLLADMKPPQPSLGRRVTRLTFTTLRTVACAGIVGVTLFSVAHADKWLARGHSSAHASELNRVVAAAEARPEQAPTGVQALAAVEIFDVQPTAAAIAPAQQPTAARQPAKVAPSAGVEPLEVEGSEQTDEAALVEEALRDGLRTARRAMAQSRFDDAEAAYGSVLAERPRHPGALAGLARVGLARGDLDSAYKFAQQAVQFAPAHAVYHVTLADVLRARGETAGADLEYETAARISRKPLDRAAKMLPQNPF